MRLYHGTTLANAEQLASNGFQDMTSNFGLYSAASSEPINTTGVFFSNLVLDENEGICSEAYLVLEIPDEHLDSYEWMEEGKGYREWCIPAGLANSFFTNHTIYSWEDVPESSATARGMNRGQSPAAFGYLGDLQARDGGENPLAGQAEILRHQIEELGNLTLLCPALEFAAALDPEEMEGLRIHVDQTIEWFKKLRERFP